LTLDLRLLAESRSAHQPAFLAVDVADAGGTVLMQALPRPEGFIEDDRRDHRVHVEIELPPLIPGTYFVTIWVGNHHTDTLDEVKDVVAFEVIESPTRGRTYPHEGDHGYLVPRSTIELADGV
jgi:lipopolysaccharide transport system ATP-binding protein